MCIQRTAQFLTAVAKARFPFKRNRLRCVNENRKRLSWQAAIAIMVAPASTELSYWLTLAFVAWYATNASASQ